MENNDFNKDMETETEEIDFDKLIESIPSNFNTQNVQEPQKQKKDYKTSSVFFHLLCVFCVIITSFLFVFQVYLTPISVYGLSMYPTINYSAGEDDDRSKTDLVYYREKESYNRGDIVIFSNLSEQYVQNNSSSKPVSYLIKRVIACPGDTITFYLTDNSNDSFGIYYYSFELTDANGTKIEVNETYINEPMCIYKHSTTAQGKFSEVSEVFFDTSLPLSERRVSLKISDGCYFVMGDNRNNSSDSRYFGEINQNDICGNVRLHIKYGENIFTAIIKQIKSYFSNSFLQLKEYL